MAFSDLTEARAWLDGHQNLERMLATKRLDPPDPARMRALMDLLGNPQRSAPVIHVTGTNGKTSTSRAITSLLMESGLSVGTYTSPDLGRINQRITANLEPIDDEELTEVLGHLADLEPMWEALWSGTPGPGSSPDPSSTVPGSSPDPSLLAGGSSPDPSLPATGEGSHDQSGQPVTWFELVTAAAFLWFADKPVDVMVIEVGLGGRFDATNVADGLVSVVTNVGLDHVEILGPTKADIAAEKAGIIKAGSSLVLGEPDAELFAVFAAEEPASITWIDRDYGIENNQVAVGGRSFDLQTRRASYEAVWLSLHGAHQAVNFATAAAAVEAFFGNPISDQVLRNAAASMTSPGRLEVMSRKPLVIIDGAKNPDGVRAALSTVQGEFGTAPGGPDAGDGPLGGTERSERRLTVVFGMLRGHSPEEMLGALGPGVSRLVLAAPDTPRAVPTETLAGAAEAMGYRVQVVESVAEAVRIAVSEAGAEDIILITGSLYVASEARAYLTAGAG